MKATLSLFAVFALGFAACDNRTADNTESTDSPPNETAAIAEPALDVATNQAPTSETATIQETTLHAALVEVWTTNDARDWDSRWTRRGKSNVFDIHTRNHMNGETETFTATVAIAGRNVVAERNDGVHYRGILSADGTQFEGAVSSKRNGSAPWVGRVAPQIVQAPKPPRFAPEGILFLLRSMSVTTESGIVGLHPGAELRLLRDDIRVSCFLPEFLPGDLVGPGTCWPFVVLTEESLKGEISEWPERHPA
jgi:hypothetical protein